MLTSVPIVVLSHLRWDFVFQRPQHLLTRLAANRPVYYIEEPVLDAGGQPHWVCHAPAPNVVVCQPHTAVTEPGFSDAQLPVLRQLMRELVAEHNIREAIAWFYTPLAWPLLDTLPYRAIVYDCMDELSLFLYAPAALLENEAQLLAQADVVFTGGPSLFRAKRGRNPNVHCFPSSVEVEHFQPARPGATPPLAEPADQRNLARPRLGYYGVIDERMDLALLAALAQARPDWQIVMVGPVVKIDPANLPRADNLHYLGQRTYAQLPAYLSGWDVCLIPFARNAATRFISPTKTLEYMAAERMIVSTPITDVAELYRDIVFLGEDPASFVAACEAAVAVNPAERQRRTARMREVLSQTSWEATARGMERQLSLALARQPKSISKVPA